MPLQPAYERSLDPLELAQLATTWGAPILRQVALNVDDPFLTGAHQLLTSDGRRAEICYVMHHGDPQTGLLLHIKSFYPEGAYRLPTGGVQTGESVLGTLGREIYEETGLVMGDKPGQVKLQRLLGILSYDLFHRRLGPVEFATYFFLVQAPPDVQLQPVDPHEQIAGWQWRAPSEMGAVADLLDAVHTRSHTWGDWGRFRAPAHRLVGEWVSG